MQAQRLDRWLPGGPRGTLLRKYILRGSPVPMYLIQKRMRRCRYPYGAMVALLLEEAGLRPHTVVDLTYGLGKFWSCWRPSRLIGYDIRRLNWVEEPDEFRKAPAWAALHHFRAGSLPRPDLVATDPPWQRCESGNGCRGLRFEVGGAWWFRVSRAVGTPETILASAARLAQEIGAPLLVHFEEEWVPDGFSTLVSVWWRPSLPRASPSYKSWWGVLVPERR